MHIHEECSLEDACLEAAFDCTPQQAQLIVAPGHRLLVNDKAVLTQLGCDMANGFVGARADCAPFMPPSRLHWVYRPWLFPLAIVAMIAVGYAAGRIV
jgi:hypothetical protein